MASCSYWKSCSTAALLGPQLAQPANLGQRATPKSASKLGHQAPAVVRRADTLGVHFLALLSYLRQTVSEQQSALVGNRFRDNSSSDDSPPKPRGLHDRLIGVQCQPQHGQVTEAEVSFHIHDVYRFPRSFDRLAWALMRYHPLPVEFMRRQPVYKRSGASSNRLLSWNDGCSQRDDAVQTVNVRLSLPSLPLALCSSHQRLWLLNPNGPNIARRHIPQQKQTWVAITSTAKQRLAREKSYRFVSGKLRISH